MENKKPTVANVFAAGSAAFDAGTKSAEDVRKLRAVINADRQRITKIEAKIAKAQDRLQKAQEKSRQLNPYGNDSIVRLLGTELLPFFPGAEMACFGPCGIYNTYYLSFKDDSKADDVYLGMLQIRFDGKMSADDPQPFEMRYVDTRAETQSFPKNSVGAINGGNYPTVKISPDTSLDDLANIARQMASA